MGVDKSARYWVAGIHISQMNNGGICMVTLADHEAALANERMPPDGYSLVETAAYNGLREAMIAAADENASLKKALAEKDVELARMTENYNALKATFDLNPSAAFAKLAEKDKEIDLMAQALEIDTMARLKTALLDLQRKYNELLFQVSTKFPHESRHDTALRYIKQAEAPQNNPPQAALGTHDH